MFFGETVQHTRRETYQNELGQTLSRDVDLAPVNGCSMQGTSTAEPSEGTGFKVTMEAVLYVPPGTDVRPADGFTVRGVAYEVQGQPFGEVNGFTGRAGMIPVQLKRLER